MKKILFIFIGGFCLYLFLQLGNDLAQRFELPLPGSMVGTILLFLCLWQGWLPLKWIEDSANLLLNHLLLFFIPAAVGIMKYPELIIQNGFALLTTIAISTALVMAGTGLCAEKLQERKGEKA